MSEQPKVTKQEAIDELRKEAQEIKDRPRSIKEYASITHKVKIRLDLADKLERELNTEKEKETRQKE
jgi:hypothetical protein